MDHNDGDKSGDWHSLGDNLQLYIYSFLRKCKDKDSLQAVMETSRNQLLLASSLITAIEIGDASALARYPRHAADLTSIWLRMSSSHGEVPVYMEPPLMVTWLQATSAACNRLSAVTIVRLGLLYPDAEYEAMDPAIMEVLLASIGRACPNLRCLRIDKIDRNNEVVVRAMFAAIGRHLPGIVELQLYFYGGGYLYQDFQIGGIDWEACLPRGLQKFTSHARLHHELLQQLVMMPSLTEVRVHGLSFGPEEMLEVQSEACAWRILRIDGDFPAYEELGRFTAAMPFLHLHCESNGPATWCLAMEQAAIVAKAAAWLSQICNPPKELRILFEAYAGDGAPNAGLISSLAPLSSLVSIILYRWPIAERTLDELAAALPNVHKLSMMDVTITDSAWLGLQSLRSISVLTIGRLTGGKTIPLAKIIEFVNGFHRPMAITFGLDTVAPADQASWKVFEEEQRQNGQLQGISVHIAQKYA